MNSDLRVDDRGNVYDNDHINPIGHIDDNGNVYDNDHVNPIGNVGSMSKAEAAYYYFKK